MGEGGARWTCADAKMEMGRRACQSAETEGLAGEGETYHPWQYPGQSIPTLCRGGLVGGSQVGMLRVEVGEQASEVEPWRLTKVTNAR